MVKGLWSRVLQIQDLLEFKIDEGNIKLNKINV